MKQLDIVVSPPAVVWTFEALTLTQVTFDFDPCDFWPRGQISMILTQMVLKIWIFSSNFFLVNYYLVTFGIVTDRQMDRRKVMHKSSPCISTGGIKKGWGPSYFHKCNLKQKMWYDPFIHNAYMEMIYSRSSSPRVLWCAHPYIFPRVPSVSLSVPPPGSVHRSYFVSRLSWMIACQ